MKNFQLAALALTCAAIAAPAQAQSTVTIFGVIDLAARQVKNNTSQKRLESGGLTTSRLGFRATEDLGGGLKAGFHLEGAVLPDDGNVAGFNWQRRSTVSLMGGFGEVRLGRDKTPSGVNFDQLDPFADTGMGASTRLTGTAGGGLYNGTTFTRASNGIAYLTPGTTGFFAQVTAAAGEGVTAGRYVGGRAGYRDGALFIVGSYAENELSSSTDAKLYDIGATYDLKSIKFWGMFAKLDQGSASMTNMLVGLSAPVGAFDLRATYQQMEGDETISNREAKKIAIGASYNLSRRTALYATYADISNTNTNFTVGTGSALSIGRDSTGYEFGVRHSF